MEIGMIHENSQCGSKFVEVKYLSEKLERATFVTIKTLSRLQFKRPLYLKFTPQENLGLFWNSAGAILADWQLTQKRDNKYIMISEIPRVNKSKSTLHLIVTNIYNRLMSTWANLRYNQDFCKWFLGEISPRNESTLVARDYDVLVIKT